MPSQQMTEAEAFVEECRQKETERTQRKLQPSAYDLAVQEINKLQQQRDELLALMRQVYRLSVVGLNRGLTPDEAFRLTDIANAAIAAAEGK